MNPTGSVGRFTVHIVIAACCKVFPIVEITVNVVVFLPRKDTITFVWQSWYIQDIFLNLFNILFIVFFLLRFFLFVLCFLFRLIVRFFRVGIFLFQILKCQGAASDLYFGGIFLNHTKRFELTSSFLRISSFSFRDILVFLLEPVGFKDSHVILKAADSSCEGSFGERTCFGTKSSFSRHQFFGEEVPIWEILKVQYYSNFHAWVLWL